MQHVSVCGGGRWGRGRVTAAKGGVDLGCVAGEVHGGAAGGSQGAELLSSAARPAPAGGSPPP